MPTRIIDVHAHTTNKELWDLHVKTARIIDLEDWARKFGVVKIILMATYFPFKKSGLPNRELLRRIAGNKLFAMCASLDVVGGWEKGLEEIEDLAKAEMIRGIKLYPGYQELDPSDRTIYPVYELAEKFGLPVIFHAGELHHCCPKAVRENGHPPCGFPGCKLETLQDFARPAAMAGAIENFPNVAFVISHLGNPYFSELHKLMADCPNVLTDVSGQFLSDSEEDYPGYRDELEREIKHVMESPRGEERLMFGTDFPIQSYQNTIELVESLGLNEDQKQKIYFENAQRVFNLNL
jgi:hypothetical protein